MERERKSRREELTTPPTGQSMTHRFAAMISPAMDTATMMLSCKAWSLMQGVGLQASSGVDVQGKINAIGIDAMHDVKPFDHSTNHT